MVLSNVTEPFWDRSKEKNQKKYAKFAKGFKHHNTEFEKSIQRVLTDKKQLTNDLLKLASDAALGKVEDYAVEAVSKALLKKYGKKVALGPYNAIVSAIGGIKLGSDTSEVVDKKLKLSQEAASLVDEKMERISKSTGLSGSALDSLEGHIFDESENSMIPVDRLFDLAEKSGNFRVNDKEELSGIVSAYSRINTIKERYNDADLESRMNALGVSYEDAGKFISDLDSVIEGGTLDKREYMEIVERLPKRLSKLAPLTDPALSEVISYLHRFDFGSYRNVLRLNKLEDHSGVMSDNQAIENLNSFGKSEFTPYAREILDYTYISDLEELASLLKNQAQYDGDVKEIESKIAQLKAERPSSYYALKDQNDFLKGAQFQLKIIEKGLNDLEEKTGSEKFKRMVNKLSTPEPDVAFRELQKGIAINEKAAKARKRLDAANAFDSGFRREQASSIINGMPPFGMKSEKQIRMGLPDVAFRTEQEALSRTPNSFPNYISNLDRSEYEEVQKHNKSMQELQTRPAIRESDYDSDLPSTW